MRPRSRRRCLSAAVAVVALLTGACGGGSEVGGTGAPGGASPVEPVTLRLGYFPNVTHATALVGVAAGIFERELGPGATLETRTFSAGPQAIEALFAGAVDATYIGPNPAINAYAKSGGKALRIVSGATSGGAFFAVRPGIDGPADLVGAKLATPQLGGTQDVALRAWLAEHGLQADTAGGGDVSILPQENAQTLEAFKAGSIDGAWVPEPWATRLILEGGAEVLVDEADLWPGGEYVTTHLVVSTRFLDRHPDVVRRLLAGHVATTDFLAANPAEAQRLANDQIEAITSKRVSDAVMASAWDNLTFTNDPVAFSLRASAEAAAEVGLLDRVDLSGIYDLRLLNEVLSGAGRAEVASR